MSSTNRLSTANCGEDKRSYAARMREEEPHAVLKSSLLHSPVAIPADARWRTVSHPRLDSVTTSEELDQLLSEPTELAVAALSRLDGDIMLLGAGGKMGPTLARMVRRASDSAGVRR